MKTLEYRNAQLLRDLALKTKVLIRRQPCGNWWKSYANGQTSKRKKAHVYTIGEILEHEGLKYRLTKPNSRLKIVELKKKKKKKKKKKNVSQQDFLFFLGFELDYETLWKGMRGDGGLINPTGVWEAINSKYHLVEK